MSYPIRLLYLFMLVCLVACRNNVAEARELVAIDTVADKADFNIVLSRALKNAKNSDTLSTNDAIVLVRVYNSIQSYNLDNNKLYKSFVDTFNTAYLSDIIKKFNCEVSVGLGFYCEKYQLMIGGLQFPRNSYIVIKDVDKQIRK